MANKPITVTIKQPKRFKGNPEEIDLVANLTSEEYSDLCTLIGAVAVQWSFFERILSIYFAVIVLGDRELRNVSETIIAETLESVTGWPSKTKLVRKAAEWGLQDDHIPRLAEILTRSEIIHRARNTVVHALWGKHKSEPDKWIRRVSLASDEAYVYEDAIFYQIAHEIARAANDLIAFMHDARLYLSVRDLLYRTNVISAFDDEADDMGES